MASEIAPKMYCKMGRSQRLVLAAEKVLVDSKQMTVMAMTTGAQTLSHQSQPVSARLERGDFLEKKTGRILL